MFPYSCEIIWYISVKNTIGSLIEIALNLYIALGESEVAQSCPTLSDPMDYSPPGSSIHGTFQARVLEWGAIAFSWHALYEYNSQGVSAQSEHILKL